MTWLYNKASECRSFIARCAVFAPLQTSSSSFVTPRLCHAHNNSEFLNAPTAKTMFMAHLKMHLNCVKFLSLAFEYFNRRLRVVAVKGGEKVEGGVW